MRRLDPVNNINILVTLYGNNNNKKSRNIISFIVNMDFVSPLGSSGRINARLIS